MNNSEQRREFERTKSGKDSFSCPVLFEPSAKELSPVRWQNRKAMGVYLGKSGWIEVKENSMRTASVERKNCYRSTEDLNEEQRDGFSNSEFSAGRPSFLNYHDIVESADEKFESVSPIISPPAAFKDMRCPIDHKNDKKYLKSIKSGVAKVNVPHTAAIDFGTEKDTHYDESLERTKHLKGVPANGGKDELSKWAVHNATQPQTHNLSSSSLSSSPPPSPIFSTSSLLNSTKLSTSYSVQRCKTINRKTLQTHRSLYKFKENQKPRSEHFKRNFEKEYLKMKRSKSFQVPDVEFSPPKNSLALRGNENKSWSKEKINVCNVQFCDKIGNQNFGDWERKRQRFLSEAAKEVQIVTDYMNGSRCRAAARNLLFHRFANRLEVEANAFDADMRFYPEYEVNFWRTGKVTAWDFFPNSPELREKSSPEESDRSTLANSIQTDLYSYTVASSSSSSSSSSLSSSSSPSFPSLANNYFLSNNRNKCEIESSLRAGECKKSPSKMHTVRKKEFISSIGNSVDFNKSSPVMNPQTITKHLDDVPLKRNSISHEVRFVVSSPREIAENKIKREKPAFGFDSARFPDKSSEQQEKFSCTSPSVFSVFSEGNPINPMESTKDKLTVFTEDEFVKKICCSCDQNKNSDGAKLNSSWRRLERQQRKQKLQPWWQIDGIRTVEQAQNLHLDPRRRSSSLPKWFRSETQSDDSCSHGVSNALNFKNVSYVPVFEYATKMATCVGPHRNKTTEDMYSAKPAFSRDKLNEKFKKTAYLKRLMWPPANDFTSNVSETALHRFKRIVMTKLRGKGNENYANEIENCENCSNFNWESFLKGQLNDEIKKKVKGYPESGQFESSARESVISTKKEIRKICEFENGDQSKEADIVRHEKVSVHIRRKNNRSYSSEKIHDFDCSDDDNFSSLSPPYIQPTFKPDSLVVFHSLQNLHLSGNFSTLVGQNGLVYRSFSDPGLDTVECVATDTFVTGHVDHGKKKSTTSSDEDCENFTVGGNEPLFFPRRKTGKEAESETENQLLAEARWDHAPAKQNELVLKAGDIIEVLDAADKNWWWGVVGHHSGYFPSSCVELLSGPHHRAKKCVPSVVCNNKYSLPDVERPTNVPTLSKEENRSNVVRELLNAERDYVNGLKNVVDYYVKRCEERSDIFSQTQIRSIFSNLEEVLHFQKRFLSDLEGRVDMEYPHKSCIGETFIIHKTGFQLYSEYCNSHPVAIATLQDMYKRKHYNEFFEDCASTKHFMKIPLDGYLLTPIQRICKYPLQLKELLKNTRPDHPDYVMVREALETMRRVVTLINEKKRKMEGLEKLFEWQSQVDGWEGQDLTILSSQLIFQGEVAKARASAGVWINNLTLFLFDRQLVYCKKDLLKRNLYIYKGRIFLDDANVTDITDGKNQVLGTTIKHGIQIINKNDTEEKKFVFCCRSECEKLKWIEALAEEREFVVRDVRAGLNLSPAARNFAKISAATKTLQSKPKKRIFK